MDKCAKLSPIEPFSNITTTVRSKMKKKAVSDTRAPAVSISRKEIQGRQRYRRKSALAPRSSKNNQATRETITRATRRSQFRETERAVKKTFVGGQFPHSRDTQNGTGSIDSRESSIPVESWRNRYRFHDLPAWPWTESRRKKLVSSSPQRLWANGRGSNFASCRELHHPERCSRYRVFRPRIRRTRRVYTSRHSKPPRGERRDRLEKSSMRYATRESRASREARTPTEYIC